MSKKIDRPPKISGTDENFRGRPKFPGPTKFSEVDHTFPGDGFGRSEEHTSELQSR